MANMREIGEPKEKARSPANNSGSGTGVDENIARQRGQEGVSVEQAQENRVTNSDTIAIEDMPLHERKPSGDQTSSSSPDKAVKIAWPECESLKSYFVTHYFWIPQNWTWNKIKPVIRCALAGWISVVLFVIPKVELMMGSAGFLILIAAFLSAPCDPFVAAFEREFLFLFMCCLTWAWSCLGIFLANISRRVHVPNVTLAQVIDGKYIEAGPSVIMAVFIFFGSALLLWLRASQGPGPFLFPTIIACLSMDICLTTAALFPYPFYLVGRSVLIPLSVHSAIALLLCLLVFPSTISATFTTRLSSSLTPVVSTFSDHIKLLATPLTSNDFAPLLEAIRKDTRACETEVVALAAADRLLKYDLIYARFSPKDFLPFREKLKRLAGRIDGLAIYFYLVDPARERFPGTAPSTPVASAPGTPRGSLSRSSSRTSVAERNDEDPPQSPKLQPPSTTIPSARVASSHPKHLRSQTHSTPHSHLQLPDDIHRPRHHRFISHQLPQRGGDGLGQTVHHSLFHSSLLSLARVRAKKTEHAVGTFESQRYLNLESTRLLDPNEDEWNEKIQLLLKNSCTPLLEVCSMGVTTVDDWLSTVRKARFPAFLTSIGFFPSKPDETWLPWQTPVVKIFNLVGKGPSRLMEELRRREERVRRAREVRGKLANALEAFRVYERHTILEPYKYVFEEGHYDVQNPARSFPTSQSRPNSPQPRSAESFTSKDGPSNVFCGQNFQPAGHKRGEAGEEHVVPPHRCLFNSFLYQYNLMQIASIILEMLDEILRLEEIRPHCRLWTPLERIMGKKWDIWSLSEPVDSTEEDEDPDIIQGRGLAKPPSDANPRCAAANPHMPSKITGPAFHVETGDDLGLPQRRDPDHLPPKNVVEAVMSAIYRALLSLGTGNVLFAIKGGLLSVLLALPGLLKHSAKFAYENRFVWGIFMGQMALARFQGDTTFALSARITSTFFGALIGLAMWYISCGSGPGNPFGLAAVCAVCFPFFFYARLYWPIPLLRNFVFFVTITLVIGYSYQDAHLNLPGNIGYGWPVAWRRFVAVTCGVSAAFIASFFPPATTIRQYQRQVLATTSCEMGNIYCSILSFANTKYEPEIQETISTLLAVRNKLGRLLAMRANVGYELSLKGRWPADRYQKIVDLQMGISYCLSHLMSILEHMEPAWARAFLRRTRFMDPDFQGDVLAVISMVSFALRTGSPLPQITPCPLVDRFMLKYHGLDVIHKDSEEDYGLPRTLSMDTLRNEQYLMFCVGIATAFSFVGRLDRLMVAVKEVVGEQYHIHGVGILGTRMPAGYSGSIGVSSVIGPRSGGGVPLGPRTNTVQFPPTQV